MTSFHLDLSESSLITSPQATLTGLVYQYNSVLTCLLDKHVPLQQRAITLRPNSPWFNDELDTAKQLKRKLERKWRKTCLTVDHQIYRNQCKKFHILSLTRRKEYFSSKVSECGNDQGRLFKLAKRLMGKRGDRILPDVVPEEELASQFSTHFSSKIDRIHHELEAIRDQHHCPPPVQMEILPCSYLSNFRTVSSVEVEKLIGSTKTKTCALDPLPTWLVKKCLPDLLPAITKIINLSISNSEYPDYFKEARVCPILKKSRLNKEDLSNYRPVSNLSFVSKLVERVVHHQLDEHLSQSDMFDHFQSAYCKFRSTETALLTVQTDVMSALDRGSTVALVLLDLSAAFDTLDHTILLARLQYVWGIQDTALRWFKSYLSGRCQSVQINRSVSKSQPLSYGVPQGSCFGPKLFLAYIQPLSAIIQQHGLQYHCYADDTQLYLEFSPESSVDACSQINKCVSDIRTWMRHNMLKLNDSKTDIIVFASKSKLPLVNNLSFEIGETSVLPSCEVRNLGVKMNSTMNMDNYVNSLCRSSYAHLCLIGSIRKFMTDDAVKTLIHGLVLSRLDYANSLLCAAPEYLLLRLQRVQNLAARIITRTPKYEHITPALKSLHWLPVKYRVQFKILLLVYKSLHGLAPAYLKHLLQTRVPSRILRGHEKRQLVVPVTKSVTYGDKCFSSVAPRLWNSILIT